MLVVVKSIYLTYLDVFVTVLYYFTFRNLILTTLLISCAHDSRTSKIKKVRHE